MENDQRKVIKGGEPRTIEVGTVGVYGWNLTDRDIESWCQGRLVGHRFETLQRHQQLLSVLLRVARSYLHGSYPFFTLCLGDGSPFAPDPRFRAGDSVGGRDEREELKSQEYVLH